MSSKCKSESECKIVCKKEYQEIYKNELDDDWLEFELYANYLRSYCDIIGVEDKPKISKNSINMASFVGIYKFRSGRILRIDPDPTKISEDEQKKMCEEIIQWAIFLGPNISSSLEMIDPIWKIDLELSFSDILNELTIELMKEYLPPDVQNKEYVTPNIIGKIDIPKTMKYITQGKFVFASKRTLITTESLSMLFLLRFHYEILMALNKSQEIIKNTVKSLKLDFALLRHIKRNRNYHLEFLLNPFRVHLLERAIDLDFNDPYVIDKIHKEASGKKTLRDLVYLWNAYHGIKIPKPNLKNIFNGSYTFKPASKLYELWVLKTLLEILSQILKRKWTYNKEKKNGVLFTFNLDQKEIILSYNLEKILPEKFDPNFRFRPDFILISKDPYNGSSRVLLIADAKYKIKPEQSDFAQMLAYMLDYCWDRMEKVANGMLLYLGTRSELSDSCKQLYKRIMFPNAKIYSICLRPAHKIQGKTYLKKILKEILDKELESVSELSD